MNIICAGMRRSGSTWLYNVMRLICANDGGVYGSFEDDATAVAISKGKHAVIKTHKYQPVAVGFADIVAVTHRHPLDVAASAIRRNMCANTPVAIIRFLDKAIVYEYEAWTSGTPRESLFVVPYHDIAKSKPETIRRVAERLGLDCDPQAINVAVESLTPPKDGAPDPEILLHANHITDGRCGAWNELISEPVAQVVRQCFAGWMHSHGYK